MLTWLLSGKLKGHVQGYWGKHKPTLPRSESPSKTIWTELLGSFPAIRGRGSLPWLFSFCVAAVVVVQNATVLDLKKAIQRYVQLRQEREGGIQHISW